MDNDVGAAVAEIREHLLAADEDSLWLVAFALPSTTPLLAVAFAESANRLRRGELRNLARVMNGIGAPRLLVAITRASGTPLMSDYQLWRTLPGLIDKSIDLIDVVVIGAAGHWCARSDSRGPCCP